MIFTCLLIPVVLLISGGDPGWWQAWLYSAMIVIAGMGPRLWAEKRHPGLLEERGKFELDNHSSDCSADHCREKDHTGRSNFTGKIARVPGLFTPRALPVNLGNLLRSLIL